MNLRPWLVFPTIKQGTGESKGFACFILSLPLTTVEKQQITSHEPATIQKIHQSKK
jgi:hypothetical protein